MIAYDSSAVLGFTPDGGPEIEHGGERLPLLMSGRADLPQRGALARRPSGASSSTTSTRKGDLHVTYECRNDDPSWEVSEGRAIDAAAVEILA